MSFIFTCKEATHPRITETVANSYPEEASRREWNGRHHHGYNLEHDFGHGEDHTSELFCLLNLLAFQFHTIPGLCDEDYRKARVEAGRLFQQSPRRYGPVLHTDWHAFILYSRGGGPDG